MTPDSITPTHVNLARELYSRLQPGQEIKVSAMLLSQPSLDHYLSGAVSSGYHLGYRFPGSRPEDFKNWTLFNLNPTLENDPRNRRSYVDPDRRHLYTYDQFSGIYTPTQTKHDNEQD